MEDIKNVEKPKRTEWEKKKARKKYMRDYYLRRKGYKDNKISICKTCTSADTKKWRDENRAKHNAYQNEYRKKIRAEAKLYRESLKNNNK